LQLTYSGDGGVDETGWILLVMWLIGNTHYETNNFSK